MELQHINVKIFVEGEAQRDLAPFIDVFHQWIREEAMSELLVDVADYRHVPSGPGVILIGLEADYSMDQTTGRLGLRYNRKAPLDGSNLVRFRQAAASAARACWRLEEHFAASGGLLFDTQELELFVNDRILAPNTPETFGACRPEIEAFLGDVLGHDDFTLDHDPDPRKRFGVHARIARPFDLTALSTACGA